MIFNTDCRHWRGDKPCLENRLCDGCLSYLPLQEKILIIKLGARGDVLRTTPLLAGLRKRHPQAHITWLTAPESLELLEGLPGINRLLAYSAESLVELLARRFDLAICLDKEAKATGVVNLVQARRKAGWGLAENGVGTPGLLNNEAAYSLALGVSDELKFRQNTKTYLQIIFEAVGLTYGGEPYAFCLTDPDRTKSKKFFKQHKLKTGAPVVGFFTGCGQAFGRKRWSEKHFAQLARKVQREGKARVLLMAGPEERAINARIRRASGLPLLDTRGDHTLRELAGFLEACRVVVTGDTIALHLALALKRPAVALFGPTTAREIEMFGLGEKIESALKCSPCYQRTCEQNPTCMDAISVARVWEALKHAGKGNA